MDKEPGLERFDTSGGMATAEMVTDGHPDKLCDQVADAILNEALRQDPKTRAGIECLAKDHLLIVSGEMSTGADLDIEGIARTVWESVMGYGPSEELTVINHSKLQSMVIEPILGPLLTIDSRVVINGTRKFTIGGPRADAGVVGRKIVVDAYGPRVPVGGGAYSGKDPSKVDRSAAYMARHMAKSVVRMKLANECMVVLAFGIGQKQPEMVRVTAHANTRDVAHCVANSFKDLRPQTIIGYLGLQKPNGWTSCSTAAFGHYGRADFPLEQSASVENAAHG
jgi:S-adenosylmethionine synthetase